MMRAGAFAELLAEPLRSSVLKALELVPDHRVPHVHLSSASPWVDISQPPGPALALWIESGDVYELDEHGAVIEESRRPTR